ncbi:hypothetical protein [uncultured Modestobacter sp.]|uniref:hypothetical protein n=1 Tax=uncultured Modestobacter sp. TaxID=380048 RepID=UPI002620D0E6|nr:hypothetical protein [uncultured Modestobacter sp.]
MAASAGGTGPGSVGRDPSIPSDDQESSSAPAIPSFASLRATRQRSPADILVSRPDAAAAPAPRPSAPGAGRPPEWLDLWHVGLRVARWCVRQPLVTARRLLG